MKVYIVIGDDPDTEPAVQVYDTPEKAIAYAKKCVAEQDCPPENVKEWDVDGRLYCCTIGEGHQGATIYVKETELNAGA